MAETKRLYRLTYPDKPPKGEPQAQTGTIERRLTDTQAARFSRAIANGRARVSKIELVEEG